MKIQDLNSFCDYLHDSGVQCNLKKLYELASDFYNDWQTEESETREERTVSSDFFEGEESDMNL